MSVIAIAAEPVTREKLRTFHLAARGLEECRPAERLKPLLPEGALESLPRGMAEPLEALYVRQITEGRAAARTKFREQLKLGIAQLRDLLSVDEAKRTPASLQKVAASLGADADRFLSMSQLLQVFGRQSNKTAAMEPERLRRCETALAVLEQAWSEHESDPVFWLFRFDDAAEIAGVRTRKSDDPCAAALDFCKRQLAGLAPVLRAVRVAKLEAAGAYEEAIHGEALERLDWQAAEPDEIAALPPVVVMEAAERVAGVSLTSFSRLLRSGRPAQVLVASDGMVTDDLSGSVADIGALALAHRGAFVLQSSLGWQEHLTGGLGEMARTLFPAVAVVSIAGQGDPQQNALLSVTPAFPLFRYSPDKAGAWAERFELVKPQPVFADVTVLDALAPQDRYRDHFRIIPDEAWDRDQMELHEYLKLYTATPPLVVPYLSVTDREGKLQRAAVTRELVHLCFDRRRAWEMLEVLAAKAVAVAVETAPVVDEAAIREAAAKEAYLRVVSLLTGAAV